MKVTKVNPKPIVGNSVKVEIARQFERMVRKCAPYCHDSDVKGEPTASIGGVLPKIDNNSHIEYVNSTLQAYCDADWGGCPLIRRSCIGYSITLEELSFHGKQTGK